MPEKEKLYGGGLVSISVDVTCHWVVCGDLNSIMSRDERCGSRISHNKIAPMNDFMVHCDLSVMARKRCFYTWNNKQDGIHRVFTRIDRAMVDEAWNSNFPTFIINYLPEVSFDHCPGIISLSNDIVGGRKTF